MQTRTLNSWILHFATQSSVWQNLVIKKGGFIKPALKGINSHALKALTARRETTMHELHGAQTPAFRAKTLALKARAPKPKSLKD